MQHPLWCDVVGRPTATLDPTGGEHRSAPVAATARPGARVSTALIRPARDPRTFVELYAGHPVVAMTLEEVRRLRANLAQWLSFAG